MTMFKGYAHMVDLFTSFDWWDTEPHDELVNNGNYCLAKPGETYADVPPPRWLRDRANSVWAVRCHMVGSGGRQIALPSFNVTAHSRASPAAPGEGDWALLLRRRLSDR